MKSFSDERLHSTLGDINLLRATPSAGEILASRIVMAVLFIGCLVTVPFAVDQWPPSQMLYAGAGMASFAEIATGILLLTQARLLRRYSGLALGLGYFLGGLIVLVVILVPQTLDANVCPFRIWHGQFVTAVLAYAVLHVRHDGPPGHRRAVRIGPAVMAAVGIVTLIVAYLIFRPFALPVIIHGLDYATGPNLFINGIQFTVIALAWWMLVTAPRKTVLSVWMAVVACAIAIDIVLFVLGGRLFTVGLYISKLNNLIGATLIFGVFFYHYIRIQGELYRHRITLVRANRQLTRLALKDTLTGLPNRAGLERCLNHVLARAERVQGQGAVCVIDLDDFKKINDQYGHETGDRLLCAFGKRVARVLRKGEEFGRLGGDEFVLVLEDLLGMEELEAVMDRVTNALAEPFSLPDGSGFRVNVSIGAAFFRGQSTVGDLMRGADQALYRVKADKAHRRRNWAVCSRTLLDAEAAAAE